MNQHRNVRALVAAALMVGVSQPALAQSVDQPAANQGTASSADPAAQNAAEPEVAPQSDIVVTGSRIVRRDYTATSPVATLGPERLENTGSATLDTALVQQPQFVASTGSTTNSNGNAGQANVQLRGLGRQRTLVLLDGRRLPPANADGSTDLNLIPTSLISDVEVITGGASAVYGSDAVAGVVNIKLKTKYRGIGLTGQYGISSRGDAADYRLGAIAGTSFADGRGEVMIAGEMAKRNPVFIADRSFSFGANQEASLPQGTATFAATNQPSQAAINSVFSKYGVAPGTVVVGNSYGFNSDNTLFSTGRVVSNYRGSLDPAFYVSNGTQILADSRRYRFLQLPLERYSTFGRVSYKLTDNLDFFVQGLYTHSTASVQLNPTNPSAANGFAIPVTNPFIPGDLKTLLAARPSPNATFTFFKRFDDIGPRRTETKYDTYQVTSGLAGKLPFGDWRWDVTGSYGKNDIKSQLFNQFSRAALQRLLNASDGGASLCSGGYNPFGAQPLSDSCRQYLIADLHNAVSITQKIGTANVQGTLFSLPAGDAKLALGVEHREDGFRTTPDARITAGDITLQSGLPFAGSTKVTEGYAEALLPLIHDVPLIKLFELDLGYRYSDYNTIGAISTYKAEANWEVIDALRLRGGYNRAIRAPNIGELFTPVTTGTSIIGNAGTLGNGDPCDIRGAYRVGAGASSVRGLCLTQGVPNLLIDNFTYSQQSATTTSGGNLNLRQETADTISVGAVLRPKLGTPLFDNLSLSVDYYRISVKDAIGSIPANLVLANCFNVDGVSNPTYSNSNQYCALVTRDPTTGVLNNVRAQLLNLGGYRTAGVDVSLDWRTHLDALGLGERAGELRFNMLATYLADFKIQTQLNDAFRQYAGTIGNGQVDPVAISRPRWKANASVSYVNGPVTVGAVVRYIDKMSAAANVGTGGTAPGVPAVTYLDLNGRVRVGDGFEMFGTIVNAGDKHPPVYPSAGSTDLATYDVIGRRFTIGARVKF
ncbi:TonB-dependent receptor domain-containing protein [Parablastomonas sp. CN1-191]|uniref:TonB-dependent receptor domain-containing protein n=1 Tax=Parablastomonas sp. CN1-191 TaxID=3400908 RepID=UPI003BF8F437